MARRMKKTPKLPATPVVVLQVTMPSGKTFPHRVHGVTVAQAEALAQQDFPRATIEVVEPRPGTH